MTQNPAVSQSPCLDNFHEFYAEVLRFKQALTSIDPEAGLLGPDPESEPESLTPEHINHKLLSVLQRQALEASRRGGEYGAAFYKEAQYIMAALGDETFLHLPWSGREAWQALLLEYKLFGTHNAGEQFFEKIDTLLSERDAANSEIALIYLAALGLGFQGIFRGRADTTPIEQYRRKLFAFINHREPRIGHAAKTLFPDAYGHTLEEAQPKRLPHVKKWLTILGLSLLVFLVISQICWINVSEELDLIVQKILTRGS